MVPLLPILRNRRRRREAARRSPLPGLTRIFLFIFVFIGIIVVCGSAFAFFLVNLDIPPLETLARLIEPPDGMIYHPTQIYDRSGKNLLIRLENPAAQGRQYLPVDEEKPDHIPASLAAATVTIRDPDFWNHPGITWQSLRSPAPVTIAERLVDQFLLPDDPPGLMKSIRQKWLAYQITRRYGKPRILEWYLNSANYGRLAYGVDAAARVYFGKPAGTLNLAEVAMLAALPDAPALNPIDSPPAARERQGVVLTLLRENGQINQSELETAMGTVLKIQEPQEWPDTHAGAFTQYAIRQLVDRMGWERVERGGLEIITTLDLTLQEQAICTAQIHLDRLKGMSTPFSETESSCEAARLLPTLANSSPNLAAHDLGVDLAVMDVKTGQILALASQHPDYWETSMLDGRPAGSLLTPFVAAAGFTRGYTPATLVWDLPGQSDHFSIPHYGKTFDGPLRLRDALVNDILAPFTEIYDRIGHEDITRQLNQLGISAGSADSAQVLWEGGKFHLLDLTQAYATLANQGMRTGQDLSGVETPEKPKNDAPLKPSALLKVTDIANHVWIDWSNPQTRVVLSPQLAYLMTNILGDEPLRWKTLGSPNPLEIDRPAGVKIGRTRDGRDAWTIGYTPELTAGVWIGDLNTTAEQDLPFMAAAPLWNAIMRFAQQDTPVQSWIPPDGIHAVQVCDPSGMLPSPDCPNIVREVFLRGTEPTQPDDLFYPEQIDRETGRLATYFTDFNTIEDFTFMRLPQKAHAWAQQVHLALPPLDYDVLKIPSDENSHLRIDNPAQFGTLHGLAEITGTVDIDQLSSYEVKVGQGINPHAWLKIAYSDKAPIHDAKLAEWDTHNLNGLYVLELSVQDTQKRIMSTARLITVDNRPPLLDILFPTPAQVIETRSGQDLIFQISAADDTRLDRLVFKVDGSEIGSLTQPPFALAWRPASGRHTLGVEAVDAAGNLVAKQVDFVVTNGE